jgi:hypothetical protein
MAIPIHHNKFHTTLPGKLLLPFVFVLVMSLAGWVIPAKADPLSQETNTYCLSCHSNPELSLTLPDGEQLSLYISPESHSRSIHSQEGIECQACHTEITRNRISKFEGIISFVLSSLSEMPPVKLREIDGQHPC